MEKRSERHEVLGDLQAGEAERGSAGRLVEEGARDAEGVAYPWEGALEPTEEDHADIRVLKGLVKQLKAEKDGLAEALEAALPVLVEAREASVAGDHGMDPFCVAKARAALAKARGEQ